MSDDVDKLTPADEQDMQAAEYVLGALSPAQARALEALALHDAGVRDGIAAWELRLAPLVDLVVPLTPPPVLWRRLALAAGIDSVIQAPRRGRQVFWKAATAGSLALAASLAFLLFATPRIGPEPESSMAALSPLGGPGATFLVQVGADGKATVVAVGDASVPPGRALELWAVAAGTKEPVSLGLLPTSGSKRITIALQPGTQLLVSQEQAGGSPTKAPTTAPIYGGKLTGI